MTTKKANVIVQVKDMATKGFKKMSQSVVNLSKKVLKSKLSWAALTAAIGFSLKSFAEFETKIIDVVNLLGGGQKEVEEYTKKVLELGKKTPRPITELAEALFDVVSAGVDASESMKFLEASAKLATAGVTDTKTAVDGLTSIMNAYNIEFSEAEKVSNLLFAAQVKGKTTIKELSDNIGKLAPLSRAAGLSLEEVLASMTALTKQGVKTDEAVTQIKGAINNIIAPSKEATTLAKRLSIQFDAQRLKAKGLQTVLEDVQKATKGNISQIRKFFPNIRGLQGALGLAKNGFEDLIDVQDSFADSANITQKAFELQADSISARTQIISNNFDAFVKRIISRYTPAIKTFLNPELIDRWASNFAIGFQTVSTAANIYVNTLKKGFTEVIFLFQQKALFQDKLILAFKLGAEKLKGFFKDTTQSQKKLLEEIEAKKQEQLALEEQRVAKQKELDQSILDSKRKLQQTILDETQTNNEELNAIAEEQAEIENEALDEQNETKKVKADETNASIVDSYRMRMAQIKSLRDIDLEEEISKLELLLESEKLTDEERKKLMLEFYELKKEKREEDAEHEKETLTKAAEATTSLAQKTTDILVSNEKDKSKAIGKAIKDMINSEIDAIAQVEIGKAVMEAPGTFGASLLKIPLIIAGQVGAKSIVNAIPFASGGSFVVNEPTLIPMSNGQNAVVGEAGAERIDVTPLSRPKATGRNFGTSTNTQVNSVAAETSNVMQQQTRRNINMDKAIDTSMIVQAIQQGFENIKIQPNITIKVMLDEREIGKSADKYIKDKSVGLN